MDASNCKREPKVSFSFFKSPLDKANENGGVKNSRDHGNDANVNSPPIKHRKFMNKATKTSETNSNGKDKTKDSENNNAMKGFMTVIGAIGTFLILGVGALWIVTFIIGILEATSLRPSYAGLSKI